VAVGSAGPMQICTQPQTDNHQLSNVMCIENAANDKKYYYKCTNKSLKKCN